MTQNEFKKVVVSLTIGAVMVLVILLSVMIYQLISIGVLKNEEAELEAKIQQYEVMIEQSGETLEARKTDWWIQRRAMEIGYVFEDDVPLN